MYPNVFPNNLTTIYNLVILSNISKKRMDIYPKVTKYQVVYMITKTYVWSSPLKVVATVNVT